MHLYRFEFTVDLALVYCSQNFNAVQFSQQAYLISIYKAALFEACGPAARIINRLTDF